MKRPSSLRRWLPALLLALSSEALGLFAQAPEAPRGKKYALLVGVSDYDHASLKKLRFPDNDIEELRQVLLTTGDFEPVRIFTTTRGKTRPTEAPTGADVRAALKGLLAKKTRHDTVLLALAGHGVQLKVKLEGGGKKDEGFFCPADAQLNDLSSMLGLSELFDDLKACGAGVKLVLVDASRHDETETDARNVDVALLPRPPRGVAALFSCSSGERAYETEKLGRGHGIFFHFVLEGLKGKAKNEEGEVTWDYLAAYVKSQVPRAASKLIDGGPMQSPHLMSDLVGEPPLLVRVGAVVKGPRKKPEIEMKIEAPKEVRNSIGMKLVLVRLGKFGMGSPKEEQDKVLAGVDGGLRKHLKRDLDGETPQHEVGITRPFYLGAYEVTQGQYEKVMSTNPSAFSARGFRKDRVKGLDTSSFPVDSVSWHDARAFCFRLSAQAEERKAGRFYRLPTEAEWEHACRAGTTTAFHFGASASSRQANFDGRFPYGGADKGPDLLRTTTVGSYAPNAWGLYDMHGNVREWCEDRYGRDYYQYGPKLDPTGPFSGYPRTVRGGSFANAAWGCRAAHRTGFDPSEGSLSIGFRVVCVTDGSGDRPGPGKGQERGTVKARALGEEGVVRFARPFIGQPTVTFSNTYFRVVEVTPTQFKWRHLDRTQSSAFWTARGERGAKR